MVSFVQIGHLAFTQQPQSYQESLGRFRPGNNSKIEVRTSEELQLVNTISIRIFWLEVLDVPFVSEIFRMSKQKLTILPFRFWPKFPDFFRQMSKRRLWPMQHFVNQEQLDHT